MEVFYHFIVSFTISAFLSCIWLWMWLREDKKNPEPRSKIILSFIAGALAVPCALIIESFFGFVIQHNQIETTILFAFIEELCKYAAFIIVLYKTTVLDEPIDALIYMVCIALGFATFENTLFILDPLVSGQSYEALSIIISRFIGASLVHTASSGIIGLFIGFSLKHTKVRSRSSALFGLTVATILHALFNINILSYAHITYISPFVIFGIVWGTIGVIILLAEKLKRIETVKEISS